MNISRSYLLSLTATVIQTLLIVSSAVGAVVVITRLVGGPSLAISQVSTQKATTFDVTGESEMAVAPDEARVSVGVSVNQPTVQLAQSQLNTKLNQIKEALIALDVKNDDIRTTNYSIYPDYTFAPGEAQRISGYRADTTLELRVTDFEKLNQAIDAATAAGANTVSGIQFTLSDAKRDEIEKEARKQAIDQAKSKATELAGLAGLKLGKVINVIEQTPFEQPPMMAFAEAKTAMGGGGNDTQVEPGSTSFKYQVVLSFETL